MIVILAHSTMMSLERQLKTLIKFDILPLKFRYFKRLIRFLFMNITKNPKSSLVKSLMSFKKTCGSLRRDPFKTPLFKTKLGSFLFLNTVILSDFRRTRTVPHRTAPFSNHTVPNSNFLLKIHWEHPTYHTIILL
jgi:hypothetical protein